MSNDQKWPARCFNKRCPRHDDSESGCKDRSKYTVGLCPGDNGSLSMQPKFTVTPELISAVKDAIYWVQDGYENADLDSRESRRTKRCLDELKRFLTGAEQGSNP